MNISSSFESMQDLVSLMMTNYTSMLQTTKNMENTLATLPGDSENPKSCMEHFKRGSRDNGIYFINIEHEKNFKVYCDMTTDGGGWTVFQRRKDGSVDFYRGCQDYKQGFGDLTGEFSLGNDYLAALAATCCHELRVDLEDFEGEKRHAKYGKFQVLPESENYKLLVDEYSGDAGDSLTYHNGMAFTTKDRDHSKYGENCAERWKGAWWYNNCHHSNLNGMYLKGAHTAHSEGVNWNDWTGYEYSLKVTEMKLR